MVGGKNGLLFCSRRSILNNRRACTVLAKLCPDCLGFAMVLICLFGPALLPREMTQLLHKIGHYRMFVPVQIFVTGKALQAVLFCKRIFTAQKIGPGQGRPGSGQERMVLGR